ncbi:MAG: patatin-like phospholipase family protein [Marinifilaceae bacterium]
MNKSSDQPIQFFRNIALTFSGGGYRASTFALGVLSYLNHVQFKEKPLLENVKGLSTVSGGTLTGATYACYRAKGEGFQSFFTHFYETLEKDQLLGTALKKLDNDQLWKNSHKKRSLINAFALAYDELLTQETFRCLHENPSHLEDICFNATDFSFGLAFRFQNSGKFGNYRLQNSNLSLLSQEMKISDAIASSSCFPLGFEPLVMPDDFVSDHNSEAYIAIKVQKEFKNGVGIMDGGIVDNQGIGSIMNADARRSRKGEAFDLIMVCDVGSYFMEPWVSSQIDMSRKGWGKSPRQLFNLLVKKLRSSWWMWLPILLSAVLLVLGLQFQAGTGFLIGGGAVGMLGLLAIALKIGIARLEDSVLDKWDWIKGMVPGFIRDKLVRFENLKLRLIRRMLEERGTSAVKMISEIFLKQIRRLNYQLFYTDEHLKHRRISTLIYELTKEQYKHSESDEKEEEEKLEQIQEPGDRIYASAKIASEMGTTLWFTQEDKDVHRLKNLVSCGQYTACYNLLKYCIDLKKDRAPVDDPQLLDEMIEVFQKDWTEFIDNPYFLHDGLLEVAKVEEVNDALVEV